VQAGQVSPLSSSHLLETWKGRDKKLAVSCKCDGGHIEKPRSTAASVSVPADEFTYEAK
jgi:hypothetical protein